MDCAYLTGAFEMGDPFEFSPIRQVRIKKTNASEPLMTCRKTPNRRRNRDQDSVPRIGLRA